MGEYNKAAYYQSRYDLVNNRRAELQRKLETAIDRIKRLEYGLTRIINVAPGSYEASLARECLNLEEQHANHPN